MAKRNFLSQSSVDKECTDKQDGLLKQERYDVFISYSHEDYVDENKNVIPDNEVSKIKEALTKAGITYWMEEKGIVPGEDFAAKIVNPHCRRILRSNKLR